MKVRRLVLMVIDHDNMSIEDVKSALENARYPNRCIHPTVMDAQEADIGEWSDDHPLNFHGAGEDFAAYFGRKPEDP